MPSNQYLEQEARRLKNMPHKPKDEEVNHILSLTYGESVVLTWLNWRLLNKEKACNYCGAEGFIVCNQCRSKGIL